MKKSTCDLLITVCLIIIAVSLRVVPHPANFAPVAAAAIFGGVILPRRLALWVPLSAMMISDFIIGLHSLIFVTWGSYALIALASSYWLRSKLTFLRGAVLTLNASLFFFAATNFAVWLTSGMYAHNWSGLVRCYELALPFFRNTLLSDAIYTVALFGAYGLAIKLSQKALRARYLTN